MELSESQALISLTVVEKNENLTVTHTALVRSEISTEQTMPEF